MDTAMKRLLLSILIVLCAGQAWGEQRYFSQSGDDGNAPCTNIELPCRTLSQALTSCASGDTCSFKKGDTWTDATPFYPDNGITYNSYGAGARPIFQGNGITNTLVANGKTDVNIDGIDFRNTGGVDVAYLYNSIGDLSRWSIVNCKFTSNGEWGIGLKIWPFDNGHALSDITVGTIGNGNEFTGAWGLSVGSATVDQIDTVVIQYNNFHDLNGVAVRFDGGDSSVPPIGVIIDHNNFDTITWNAILVKAGIAYNAGRSSSISYNTAREIGEVTRANINAFQLAYLDRVPVEYNSIEGCYTSVADGMGINIDLVTDVKMSDGVILQYNTVTGCVSDGNGAGIGVVGGKNCKVRYNIAYGNGAGFTHQYHTTTGNEFHNNVADGNYLGASIGDVTLGSPAAEWKNNIFSNNANAGMQWGALDTTPDETHNLFFNSPVNKNKVGTGEQAIDATDKTTDPLFKNQTINDYRIKNASPARNAGTAVAGLHDQAGCLDMAGKSCYTATPSIGAYQNTVSGGGLFNSTNRFNQFAPHRRLH